MNTLTEPKRKSRKQVERVDSSKSKSEYESEESSLEQQQQTTTTTTTSPTMTTTTGRRIFVSRGGGDAPTSSIQSSDVSVGWRQLQDSRSIEELLEEIIRNKLKIDVDYKHIVSLFHDQYIFKVSHLCRITEEELKETIQLPLVLNALLRGYCKQKVEVSNELKSEQTQLSPQQLQLQQQPESVVHLGLSTSERELLLQSWNMLTDSSFSSDVGVLTVFHQTVWEKWLENDKAAQKMFSSRSFKYREQHLTKVMLKIIQILSEPNKLKESISNLHVLHCIWAISGENFRLFGQAIGDGFTKAVGQKLNPSLKDIWVKAVTNIGEAIIQEYNTIKQGWNDELLKKNGNNWKKVYTKLTENTLYLYKSNSYDKPMDRYSFSLMTDMGTEVSGTKPNDWCFYIETASVRKYFCATSEKTFEVWVQQIIYRIKAHTRMNEINGVKSGSAWKQQTKDKKDKPAPTKNKDKETTTPTKTRDKRGKKSIALRTHLDKQIRTDQQFSLFDGLLHPTIVINDDAIILYLNPAVVDLTGYAPSELLQKNVKVLMTGEYAIVHDEYVKRFLKTGEGRVIGKGRWVPVQTSDGKEVECFLTVTEHLLTGRHLFVGTLVPGGKGDELTSSKSEPSEVLDPYAVFDNVLRATIVINSSGEMLYANTAVETITGYPKEKLIKKNVSCLMPPQVAKLHDYYLSNYMLTGESHIIGVGRDVQALRADGSLVDVHLEVTELGDGRFIGSLVNLRTKEDFLEKERSVLKSIQVPTVVIGEDGLICFTNESILKFFGYTEKEILGKNVNILMERRHAKKHNTYIQNYVQTGKGTIIGRGRTVKVKLRDGSITTVHLTVSVKKFHHYHFFIGTMINVN